MTSQLRKTISRFAVRGCILVCLPCLLIGLRSGFAQGGKATINGVAQDASGAVIVGATVTIANSLTGQSRDVTTATDGSYVATFLPVGQYSVTASHSGFRTETRGGITLTTDQVVSVNITLQVGNTKQIVEVTSGATMIQTTTAAIGMIVDSKSVVELPLNGRNPATLAFLAPGATDGSRTVDATPGPGSGAPTETAAEVNGSRMGGVYYMLDG
ncbi:MAG: carboxypeptidase-like regulatory domain-containing protein, partial [Terriglobia bacterium]